MAQYQDGDRRFGMVRRNGVWVSDDQQDAPSAAPSAPRPWVSAPREPTPQTQAQATLDRYQAQAGAMDPSIKAAQLEGIRLENEKRRHELEQGGGAPVTPRGDMNKVGEDYLRSLPQGSAADIPMLRAMSDGRMGLPSGYALRNPKAMQLVAELHQFDPTADAVNLPARIAGRKNATSGKLGASINSFNTSLGHMDDLARSVEDLHNFGGNTPLTSIANFARNTVLNNRPELSSFATARKAVADELVKSFSGSSGGLADREHWLTLFSENKSPKALRAAIAEAASLLGSKIQASEDQYNGSMGTTGLPLPMLHEHAKDALAAFQSGNYVDRGFGAIAGSLGDGGPGGGRGGPQGPLDPQGMGDIGFNQSARGLPPHAEEAQRDILAELQSGRLKTPDQIIGYAHGKWGLNISPEQAKAAAANIANGGGVGVSTPRYQAESEAAQRKQSFIDAQNITDVRGGKPGEGLDAGIRGAANTASYGLADKAAAGLGAMFGHDDYATNLARQEKIGQYDSQNHFLPQLTGSALGLMGNESAVARGVGALGRASPTLGRLAARVPQGARPALNDAAYGAIYGGVNTDGSLGDRALGAVETGAATLGGGIAGRAVGRGIGRTLTGSRDAATRALAKAGVPLTLGQIAGRGGKIGKTLKAMEDAFESIPILGAAIRARRSEGVEAYNRGTFDRALEPIGDTTKGQIAEQGVENSRSALTNAYSKALKGVNVTVQDPVFARNLARAIGNGQKLHPEVAKDFEALVKNEIAPVISKGNMTGDEFQALQQVIRQEKSAWAGQPRGRQYGTVLQQLDSTLQSLVRRQAPGAVPALNAANRAYRLSKVAEDAVGRAANTGGVFTPAQLGMAARQSGKKFGNSGATTERPFFDYQRAGQEVLPSKMGNSGTFDRAAFGALVPAALGGAGYEMNMSKEHITAMMVLGLPFTKQGQAALQKLLIERPDVVKKAGERMLSSPRSRGLFGAAGVYGGGPTISGLLSD